ncbi:MAG: hypothetical protein D6731_08305 [Planctomycetota bacterium]|nr:MAG: hypothetical protein D6731_08305 [Planctomycetota bacterium]
MRIAPCFSVACVAFALAPLGRAQEPVRARERSRADIDAGLRWLAAQQASDGSWGTKNKLALTGMSGLALLASGSTPQRGPFAPAIRRAVDFVLACQRAKGKAFWHPSNGYSAIHNHGYALLFLTQAYGEGGPLDERLRRAISLGIQATIDSQWRSGRSDGGFGYFLNRTDIPPAHRNMWRVDEASTTISQIQALRGARNAGFKVQRKALERAGDYIARSQHRATGGFYYSIGSTPPRLSFVEGSRRPTFAITAACTAVLHALGTYEGPLVDKGIAYIEGFLPPTRKKIPFFYYAHYYAAQVMHMVGGARGARWMNAIRAELAARQRQDGRWGADPEDTLAEENSEILNTAWALQILLLDRGVLPLHER